MMAQEKQFAWELYYSYENYKEKTLTDRRFKHSQILPLIERLKNNKIFRVDKAGSSTEGRDIYLIALGSGSKKVFMWSQMHGDEPTATAALFDIFNFFNTGNEFKEFKEFLLSNLTIYFLPMLNPDGAEIFQRRNIFEIDLNRDVLREQTPEAKILKNVFVSVKPDFGFNLHDQGREYSAGNSFNPASISFLAPAPDYEKTVTPPREDAMKLIGELVQVLNDFIPGHIAKYSDDYEPRAFGDNFTKWGTGVVLLETGGWRGDREKQFLRKINYIALLGALAAIAGESYKKQSTEIYDSIPENEELMMDMILRNLRLVNNGEEYLVDIGINFEEININNSKDYYLKAEIEDIGDLSVFAGYEELDLSGYTVGPGKTSPGIIGSADDLMNTDVKKLFSEGYTGLVINSDIFEKEFSELPFNIVLKNASTPEEKIKVEADANLIIRKKGMVKFAVVNGFLHDIEKINETEGYGLIYK